MSGSDAWDWPRRPVGLTGPFRGVPVYVVGGAADPVQLVVDAPGRPYGPGERGHVGQLRGQVRCDFETCGRSWLIRSEGVVGV
jgi:hypothetical protein